MATTSSPSARTPEFRCFGPFTDAHAHSSDLHGPQPGRTVFLALFHTTEKTPEEIKRAANLQKKTAGVFC